jgi:hypothetical protein
MNQAELFPDLQPVVNPSRKFETFSLPDGNVIQVPYSVWKDGRKRIDCTEYGGTFHTSRVHEIADQQAEEELRQIFRSRDEAIREHDERAIEVIRKLARGPTQATKSPRNISRSSPANKITEPSESDFYRPSEYKGLFSNCPEGVDKMEGPTHLAKRVFGHAFAIAKTYNVDRVSLNWVRTAKALRASDRGVKNAAFDLRDQWRLIWFKSTQGSPLGTTIRFLRHPSMFGSSEESSELAGNSVPNLPKGFPKSSEHSSRSNKKDKKSEKEQRKRSSSLGWGSGS